MAKFQTSNNHEEELSKTKEMKQVRDRTNDLQILSQSR